MGYEGKVMVDVSIEQLSGCVWGGGPVKVLVGVSMEQLSECGGPVGVSIQ